MTTVKGRAAGALAVIGAVAALAGCATVPGTGSANPSDVAAYQTTLASSRAAAADSAGKSACRAWRAGYDTRRPASEATITFTKGDPYWTWEGIAGLMSANFAAIATETGKLPAIITTADPNPSIRALLVDYKSKLDAYADALRADQAARGAEDQTWPKTNPANSALTAAANALIASCG
ncbi:hypothetical protein TSST111916_10100 [Tsukamurella strandjordii]|uniref:hypothetical protein n=1 Tax=Tsukamurella TaxID=2060 RepID=UPI001C7D8CED|nr:hypothetical protein [Tsukamurella sp. TY48]GIZ98069.1 hypothetical protein TTY48_26810 [Tsukamurella sp. TY48]